MYFSEHNDNITYINHYGGLLEVNGKGFLSPEDLVVKEKSGKEWTKQFNTLNVCEGITEIKEGFLDAFSHVDCLIFSRTVTDAAVSPNLLKQLRDRNVLIRGEYDTFAESFAKANGLTFLHSDIHIADDEIKIACENDIITLRFHLNAPPDILYDCYTPGISAGSMGGGEFVKTLSPDFYVNCTIEMFAEKFSERVTDQILANDALKRFLKISNERL